MIYEYPEINVPRLYADLDVSADTLDRLAAIAIPAQVWVASRSELKLTAVREVLSVVQPEREFTVQGISARSDVPEQPLGQTTIEGTLNRLRSARCLAARNSANETTDAAWIAVENGLFSTAPARSERLLPPTSYDADTIMLTAQGANLSPYYAPFETYEDRAVAAIRLPGKKLAVEVSPSSEAVEMPAQAVRAAYLARGGFNGNTAGEQLAAMGLVRYSHDAHRDLTAERRGGPLTRQDQIARVLIRALMQLS